MNLVRTLRAEMGARVRARGMFTGGGRRRRGGTRGMLAGAAAWALLAVVVAGLAAVGCTGADRPTVRIEGPPPLPRAESAPIKTGASTVWVPGYWDWDAAAGTWRWVDGAWEIPPRPGAEWVPPRHERRGDSWVLIRGFWR